MTDADPDQKRADQLAAFLRMYRPFAEGLVKEFFLKDHWHTLVPADWREPLEAARLAEDAATRNVARKQCAHDL